MSGGLVATLLRMGHDVTDIPIVPNDKPNPMQLAAFKQRIPNIEELKSLDAIIVSGPEHVCPWLDIGYTKYAWKNLGVPKAAWYHESFFRDDAMIDFNAVKWTADEHFFPAIQDAEMHDQEAFAEGHAHWLPFGVDTDVFCPRGSMHGQSGTWNLSKDFDVAFIGLLYDKRKGYLHALSRHKIPPIRCGSVQVIDMDGFQFEESARRLASNYRRIRLFFNLPAMSRLLVTKVTEVMACGTFLVTPGLNTEDGSARNMDPFKSGEHLVYYRPSHPGGTAQLLNDYLGAPESREKIAAAGCAEVRAKHTLDIRLNEILAKLGVTNDVPSLSKS
jgi:hypothetical protein